MPTNEALRSADPAQPLSLQSCITAKEAISNSGGKRHWEQSEVHLEMCSSHSVTHTQFAPNPPPLHRVIRLGKDLSDPQSIPSPHPSVPHSHSNGTPPGMVTPRCLSSCAEHHRSFGELIFPNTQPEHLLAQLKAIASHPVTGRRGQPPLYDHLLPAQLLLSVPPHWVLSRGMLTG